MRGNELSETASLQPLLGSPCLLVSTPKHRVNPKLVHFMNKHHKVMAEHKEPRVCPKCKSPYWNTPRRSKGAKDTSKRKLTNRMPNA